MERDIIRRKDLCVLLAVLIIIFAIVNLKPALYNKLSFMPIGYENVDKVEISGFINKTSNDVDTKRFVDSINEVKRYDRKETPVYHSRPVPRWSIRIDMKDKQYVTVYEDYDYKAKISNNSEVYIIDKAILQKILEENNLSDSV